MTAIERWKKGSLQAIGVMLIIALFDYFFPNPPLNQYWVCFLFGFAFFGGWLAGSEAERKSKRIHLTS